MLRWILTKFVSFFADGKVPASCLTNSRIALETCNALGTCGIQGLHLGAVGPAVARYGESLGELGTVLCIIGRAGLFQLIAPSLLEDRGLGVECFCEAGLFRGHCFGYCLVFDLAIDWIYELIDEPVDDGLLFSWPGDLFACQEKIRTPAYLPRYLFLFLSPGSKREWYRPKSEQGKRQDRRSTLHVRKRRTCSVGPRARPRLNAERQTRARIRERST